MKLELNEEKNGAIVIHFISIHAFYLTALFGPSQRRDVLLKSQCREPWNALSALKSSYANRIRSESNEEHGEALKYPSQQTD